MKQGAYDMQLDISDKEKQILTELLESRVRELHPTIRRSRVSTVTDELKHDLEDIERLLKKVQNTTGEGESDSP
jgi:hypothetical protein